MHIFGHFDSYLHLLIPTLELPANHGSSKNIHRNVIEPFSPSYNDGLSCNRKPFRNQCTECLSWCFVSDGIYVTFDDDEFVKSFFDLFIGSISKLDWIKSVLIIKSELILIWISVCFTHLLYIYGS